MSDGGIDRCTWREDEDGNWHTECHEIFCLITGSPGENNMAFCCYCGGDLIEEAYYEEEDET